MLEARDLTKRFRAATVVDRVSFAVRPGEITGYLGPKRIGQIHHSQNVCGAAASLERTGPLQRTQRSQRSDRFPKAARFVPEEPNLYGYLTGLEYLQFIGGLRGIPEIQVNRKANELLELLNLTEARWVPISAYSKGMKQRVLIAAALLHDPELLIFDEAQSGLDISNALLFRYLLQALAARGKAILYISRILELVEKTCEHIVVIYKGRVVADDSVAKLRACLQQPDLEGIFSLLVHQDDMELRARDIAAAIAQ